MTITKKWSGITSSLLVYIPRNRDIAKNHEYIFGTCRKRRSLRDYELVGKIQKRFSKEVLFGGGDFIFQARNRENENNTLSEV